jgi:hypothetical protein
MSVFVSVYVLAPCLFVSMFMGPNHAICSCSIETWMSIVYLDMQRGHGRTVLQGHGHAAWT